MSRRWWLVATVVAVGAGGTAGACAAWIILAVDAQNAREGNPSRRTDGPRVIPGRNNR